MFLGTSKKCNSPKHSRSSERAGSLSLRRAVDCGGDGGHRVKGEGQVPSEGNIHSSHNWLSYVPSLDNIFVFQLGNPCFYSREEDLWQGFLSSSSPLEDRTSSPTVNVHFVP